MSEKIRILIADDHEESRQALRKLLSLAEDMEIIGETGDGKEALVSAAMRMPDIILMDGRMPVLSGLEASRILNRKEFSCKVIMLTSYDHLASEALRAGVRGYLLKGINFEVLTDSIRKVHQGKTVIDEKLGKRCLENPTFV